MTSAIAETYEDVRHLITKIASDFQKARGGDREELISVGNYAFVIAHRTWKADKGASFANWLWNIAWKEMLKLRKADNRMPELTDLSEVQKTYRTAALPDLLDELSPDAKKLAQTAIDDVGEDNIPTARRYLKQLMLDIGWSIDTYRKAFAEIAEAL